MKYRAILYDQNDPSLDKKAEQRLGDVRIPILNWANEVLKGRKRPAHVVIYRQTEITDEVVYPKETEN